MCWTFPGTILKQVNKRKTHIILNKCTKCLKIFFWKFANCLAIWLTGPNNGTRIYCCLWALKIAWKHSLKITQNWIRWPVVPPVPQSSWLLSFCAFINCIEAGQVNHLKLMLFITIYHYVGIDWIDWTIRLLPPLSPLRLPPPCLDCFVLRIERNLLWFRHNGSALNSHSFINFSSISALTL